MRERAAELGASCNDNMSPSARFDTDDVYNTYSYTYDTTQAFNFEPAKCLNVWKQSGMRSKNDG